MPAQIGLEVYKSDLLSRLSSLLICLWILASLKHFCKYRFNGSCAIFLYFLIFKHIFFILRPWLYARFCQRLVLAITRCFSFLLICKIPKVSYFFIRFSSYHENTVYDLQEKNGFLLSENWCIFFKFWHEYSGMCWCKDFSHGAAFFWV